MIKCPQCGKQTSRQNPLRVDYREDRPKVCRECCQTNHVRRIIGGLR